MSTTITPAVLMRTAAALLSVEGENPEYDRALAELVTDLLGGTSDDKDAILSALRALHGYVPTDDDPDDPCPKCGTPRGLERITGCMHRSHDPRCADCGEWGETTGHMDCRYPKDHD